MLIGLKAWLQRHRFEAARSLAFAWDATSAHIRALMLHEKMLFWVPVPHSDDLFFWTVVPQVKTHAWAAWPPTHLLALRMRAGCRAESPSLLHRRHRQVRQQ